MRYKNCSRRAKKKPPKKEKPPRQFSDHKRQKKAKTL